MTDNQIIEYVKQYIDSKQKLISFTRKFKQDFGRPIFDEARQSIERLTDFLDKETPTFARRLFHLYHNLNYIPICHSCKTKECKFYPQEARYMGFCSTSCVNKSPDIRAKIRQTNLERHGTAAGGTKEARARGAKKRQDKFPETLKKMSATNLARYGVENVYASEEIKERIKTKLLEKYGVENPMHSEDIKARIKASNLEEYGVTTHSQRLEVAAKISASHIAHYATSEGEVSNQKRRDTCMEKYGVEYVSQDVDVFEKQQANSFLNKPYRLPSGRIIKVQGFEGMALDLLLKTYRENDIIYDVKTIHERIGIIYYTDMEGRQRRYYPDLYIPKEHRLIEVKSPYTFAKERELNLLKQQACIDHGVGFTFMIITPKGELLPE